MRTQIHNSRQITQNNSLCLHCKLFLSLHTKMSPKCWPVCLQRFAEAICCFLLKIFCLIFLLQLSVVCTWALIPTWVSTHTRPWRPTNCWGSWAWKWTEQKRRWCLLWCHIVEVHAEKCLCDQHCWFFLLFSWHYLIFNKGFPHPCTAHLLFPFFFSAFVVEERRLLQPSDCVYSESLTPQGKLVACRRDVTEILVRK